jgi:hypothetical protein
MRASSTTKIIIPTSPDIPRERKFLDGGLERMMDHAIVSNEQVEWSCTSSDYDQTGCEPEVRCEKEVTIKCAWLDKTLLIMVVQDQEHNMELQVDITMEIQGQDPLEFPPPTEANEEEPHPKDNVEHILQLQEELDKASARIEEQTKHIEDLQSELLAKDELIRSLEEKQ